ncbi:MAG: hypothetical protein LBK73_04485 [Treponema sp.]|jgi:hypothetical protein|nr:hypothetical protein [Treponema sp.]
METFDLLRKNGTKIENEFKFINSEILGIIFYGFNYTYRNPLLYYSRNILFDHNIDYFGIDYRYYDNKDFMKLNNEEQNEYFEEDTKIIIKIPAPRGGVLKISPSNLRVCGGTNPPHPQF